MYNITALPAFKDNYIWCVQSAQQALVVDPGDPDVVLHHLEHHQLVLAAILITHHHWDHVDGITKLQQRWPNVKLFMPAAEQHKIQHNPENCCYLLDADLIEIPEVSMRFQCISTPGHTLGHLCYFSQVDQEYVLFCGDTLFSGGCGRLFEGTASQMHQSLTKLQQLPAETKIYCTHEYTLSNLKFAQSVEPANGSIVEYFNVCDKLRAQGEATLPSTLKLEQLINPFLRCGLPHLQQHWQQTDAQNLFAFLREWKNRF
jgi:hydroxyacylglutathione hydrolase